MLLVAILTVERTRLDEFRDYERQAARIMERHGGRIERALVLHGPEATRGAPAAGDAPAEAATSDAAGGDTGGATLRELHVVAFPDEASADAYRSDPDLRALAPVRARCVLTTELWQADEGPAY